MSEVLTFSNSCSDYSRGSGARLGREMMAVFLYILCEEARPGPAGELTLRVTGEREAECKGRIKSRRCSQHWHPSDTGGDGEAGGDARGSSVFRDRM